MTTTLASAEILPNGRDSTTPAKPVNKEILELEKRWLVDPQPTS